MKVRCAVRALLALISLSVLPSIACAQGASEIIGQPLQVTTSGVTNTIYLDANGTARILTLGGSMVAGNWRVANEQLCLTVGETQECWPYSAQFQAGQPVSLTSSCNQSSTWLAQSTNTAPPPMQGSERGR